MRNTQTSHRTLSPMHQNFSGFLRPAHPLYPPLALQNMHMMRTPENSIVYQYQQLMMRTLQTSADELVEQQKQLQKHAKSVSLDKLANADYQPANFEKALRYRNERSYKIKKENQYEELSLFCDTNELRYFGLGTYFYIQFYRRMMWLFFVLTLLNFLSIYINFKGNGLENYSVSFSSYLMKTTLGNYSGPVMSDNFDGYIIVIVPALNFLALMIFYWVWKTHFVKAVANQLQDNKDVRPQNFTLEIEGLPKGYIQEEDLLKFFQKSFGEIYEVSVVRNYDNKLPYFEQIDRLHEQIKQRELELVMHASQKKQKQIQKKKQQLKALQQKLSQISIKPQTVSAFIHFQYEKSKTECLNHFENQYLFKNWRHCFMRYLFCCCIKKSEKQMVFHDNNLLISEKYPPHPEDINWASFEIGFCSKILRAIFAIVVILLFLTLSCTIIGLCSMYIQTHSSNCDGIDTSIYSVTSLPNDIIILQCYCNANLVSSFTDSAIQTTCNDYLKDIYVQQAIQYAVIITSSVTNILFSLISEKLINFVRPASFSATLKYKTAILTLFFTLNSLLIPVLIYANIFGFTPSSYVSFLTVISSGIRNFLKVENLSFYTNFTAIWYRNVSPIFTNYILFNTVGLWGSYIFFKCCCSSRDSLKDKESRILQKTMNKKMTDFKLEVDKEAASLYLIIIMTCIFWSGIPVLVPLAFLNIMSRYIINRSLLQNHSMRIAGLGQEFSSFSLLVLPAILILLPPMAEWMLVANSYIYPSGLPTNFSLSFLQGYSYVLDMQLYLPFYLGISAVALAQVVIYYTVIRFCNKIRQNLCSSCHQKKEIQYHARPFVEYTKNLNILCSYNIRNNDQLRNAILNLQKYLVQHDPK